MWEGDHVSPSSDPCCSQSFLETCVEDWNDTRRGDGPDCERDLNGPCEYCFRESPRRVKAGEDGSDRDMFVCPMHWKLLQDPRTAVPLIRGTLASRLRGKAPASYLTRLIDSYVSKLKKLKPKNQTPSSGHGA